MAFSPNAPRPITAPTGGANVLMLNAASTKSRWNFSVSPTKPTTATVTGREAVSPFSLNADVLSADDNNNGVRDADEPQTPGFFDEDFNRSPSGYYLTVAASRAFTLRAIVSGNGTMRVATSSVIAPNTIGTDADFGFVFPS